MKTLLTLITVIFLGFHLTAQQFESSTYINGVQRDYITYLPTNFDPQTESLPLVVVYHGLTQTNDILTLAGFNQIADTARLIIMYPQGLENDFNQTAWNNGTGLSPVADDIGFTNFMLDTAALAYNIDISKTYAVGVSMGSIMCYTLACNLNDRFAAIGAVFGPMSTQDMNTCTPSYSTPIIHFHGTNDQTVPYNTNPLPTLTLATETINWWENQKNCNGSCDSTRVNEIAQDNLTPDRFGYQGCDDDGSLEHWRTNGGDHDYYITPINDFTHFVEVWNFIRKWEHPNARNTASIVEETPTDFNIYPNPASSTINISTSANTFTLSIIDMQGKSIGSFENAHQLDLSKLTPGAYIIQMQSGKELVRKQFFVQ